MALAAPCVDTLNAFRDSRRTEHEILPEEIIGLRLMFGNSGSYHKMTFSTAENDSSTVSSSFRWSDGLDVD